MAKYSVVDREKTIQLFKRGWSMQAIALELRCNRSTIWRITHDVQRTEKSTSQAKRDTDIVRRMKAGASNQEIAIQFRISTRTAAAMRTRYGIPSLERNAKRIGKAMQDREQVLRVAEGGLRTLREIANEADVSYRFAQQTLHEGAIPFKSTCGEHQPYQPTQRIVHVPSENPRYPGFELEAAAAERFYEVRQLLRQALARGELARAYQRKIGL